MEAVIWAAEPEPKEIALDPRVSVLVTVRLENVADDPEETLPLPLPDTNAVPFWVSVPVKFMLEKVAVL